MLSVILITERNDRIVEWFDVLKSEFPSARVGLMDPGTFDFDEKSNSPNRIEIEVGAGRNGRSDWLEVTEMTDEILQQYEPEELANIRLVVPRPSFYVVRYRPVALLRRALASLADHEIWVDDTMALLLPIAAFVDLIGANPDGYMDRFRNRLK